jgi:hypothetical protein
MPVGVGCCSRPRRLQAASVGWVGTVNAESEPAEPLNCGVQPEICRPLVFAPLIVSVIALLAV